MLASCSHYSLSCTQRQCCATGVLQHHAPYTNKKAVTDTSGSPASVVVSLTPVACLQQRLILDATLLVQWWDDARQLSSRGLGSSAAGSFRIASQQQADLCATRVALLLCNLKDSKSLECKTHLNDPGCSGCSTAWHKQALLHGNSMHLLASVYAAWCHACLLMCDQQQLRICSMPCQPQGVIIQSALCRICGVVTS